MCNCYDAKCKECDTRLPIHLGDWNTEEDEIEVFCNEHIPYVNARIFTLKEDEYNLKKGYRIAIRPLTMNARNNRDLNHPNTCVDWKILDI